MFPHIRYRLAGSVLLLAVSVLACYKPGQTNELPFPPLPSLPDPGASGDLKWVPMEDVRGIDYVLVAPRILAENTNSSSSSNSLAANSISRADGPTGSPPTHVWAAVGQTQEETLKRCGDPTYWGKSDSASTTAQAVYQGEPHFCVTFITNKEGKRVSGQITYYLPRELAGDRTLAEPVILKLLEANSDGHAWTEDAANSRIKRFRRNWRREGATAAWALNTLTIGLDEYSAIAEAENKRLAAEQAARISGDAKK